ncbi:MAG: hypothetical protein IJ638_00095 [Alphaproteobacteria bacterium]|nr:hypothetical protein [Alphaproteobacteria bacterium]
MSRLKYVFMFVLFILFMQGSFAFSATLKCPEPELYGLSSDEVNMSNSEFYCWEIRYLKQYHNTISSSLSSYYNFYSKNLDKDKIEILRKLGITPEKYDYLAKYFIDEENVDGSDFEKNIKIAISHAKEELKTKLEYKYGTPVLITNSLFGTLPRDAGEVFSGIKNAVVDGNPLFYFFRTPTIYDQYLHIFSENCVTYRDKMNAEIEKYPDALKPVGIIGKYFVNAFGEVSLELYQTKDRSILTPYDIRVIGTKKSLGQWNTKFCGVTDFNKTMKRAFACTPCTMFEIAFNTVSRIGFVLYDKLSRYAIDLMIVLFSCWSLFMFFENAIKKQDGFAYIKTFFTKVVWVFIIGAFLSVSITDENNIVNYTIRPITDFMVGYTKVMTKAIDSTAPELKCRYATRNLQDTKYLFSKDVKQDIVCTIERIADFNNMNILIGISEIKQGAKQFINFKISSGVTKIILGLTIAGIFFMFNLAVPYFFIESLLYIAIVVFLFPLFLMAYAFDKGKSFVKNGLDTFLSAISQIIALSIMSSVISLLMFYISSLDFYGIQNAINTDNAQEIASSMLLFFSFNTNKLLEIIYTGIICWWLLLKFLEIANVFGSSKETLPYTFKKFMSSTVKTATSLTVDYTYMKLKVGSLAKKLRDSKKKDDEKQNRQNKESLEIANKIISGSNDNAGGNDEK